MRWIMSWYKKELTKQNFRLAGWLSVGYFIVLFLTIILGQIDLLTKANENPNDYHYYSDLMLHGGFIPAVLLFIMPTLAALVLFRYLHKQDASDFIHSLPSTRLTIYLHHIIFGVISLVLPLVLTFVSLLVVDQTLDHHHLLSITDITNWFHLSVSTALIVFSVSVFVAMLTGVTLIQLIFTYIFLFLPVGLTMLVVFNLNYALPGLAINYIIDDVIVHFSPLTDINRIFMASSMDWSKVIIYYIVTAVILFISYFLYKKRPIESANQAIVFEALKPIFIYSFTFSFTLIGGMYSGAFGYSIPVLFLMYIIFSIIGYYISQMIVDKTWRVFGKVKQYGFFFLAMTLLTIGFSFDITGFVNHIPKIDEIEEAYVIDDQYSFYQREAYYGRQAGFSDVDDLEMIQSIHQKLIDSADRKAFLGYGRSIIIMYVLDDGSELVRQYTVDDEVYNIFAQYNLQHHPIYKTYTDPLFYITPSRANKIEIMSENYNYKSVSITDRAMIVELIQLLREDTLQLPKIEDQHDMLNYLIIHTPGEQEVYIDLTQEFHQTLAWLSEQDFAKEALILPDDIVMIKVAPYNEELYYDAIEYEKAYDDNELLVYDDLASIEKIMQRLSISQEEPQRMLMIYLKELSSPIMRSVDDNFSLD